VVEPPTILQLRWILLLKIAVAGVWSLNHILATEPGIAGMTFFPGTRDALKTDVIEVSDGNPLSGLTIRVGAQK
jgi:hypothetical protein